MKRTLSILFLLTLAGCAGPNVERITRQLSARDAAFYLEIPTRGGPIRVGRAFPNVGFSTTVTGDGGVSVIVPTNVTLSVTYHVPVTNNSAPPIAPQRPNLPTQSMIRP